MRQYLNRMTSRNCSLRFNFGLGINLSTVVIARCNRTVETGKKMPLDKAKVKIYGQNPSP